MAITDWPADERPRERLLQQGPQALSDAELLAIFLRTGIPGKTAVDLARELLDQHGSLRALLGASHKEFCRSPGLGTAKYVQLQATVEMARRQLGERMRRGETLGNPHDSKQFIHARLRDYHHEVFACLFLDTRNRIIQWEELFFGTIDGASVYPREVVKRALHHNAAALIIAHNHPSGVAEPSQADLRLTQRLRNSLSLIDVRLLDHIIVGDGELTSLAEQGHM